DQPGTRPLLEPKGVVYSASGYTDFARFWDDRAKLFTPEQAKAFEDFDKSSGPFLAGTPFSKLLTQAGPYSRTVVAHQTKRGYQIVPRPLIPSFPFILEQRDPEGFSRSAETVLRGIALLAGNQARLKLTEEKHGDVNIVGYRFAEDFKLKQDVNDIRFNFSPCFFSVGNQYVLCSTVELGHELVDLLQNEAKESTSKKGGPWTCSQLYGKGSSEFLH